MELHTNKSLLKCYSFPTYNSTDASKDFSKVDIANFSKFKILHEWRDIYSRQVDMGPHLILSLHHMARLSNITASKEEKEFEEICNKNEFITKAKPTIMKLLENGVEELEKIKKQLFHNCFVRGHSVWACCSAKNPMRQKIYNSLDANRRKHENRRRKVS
jgi:hypothetical protein